MRLAVPAALGPVQALGRDSLLEFLLARADVTPEMPPWRAEALRALGLAGVDATAGLVQSACLGCVPEPWVMLATPVHLAAGTASVQLVADGLLRLNYEEHQSLAADFNSVFADSGWRLTVAPGAPGRHAQLLCLSETSIDASTHDPQAALGSDVWQFQPSGPGAARMRRLMSEVELWLFDHPINRERIARGLLAATGLWLWAGGASLRSVPLATGFSGGADPILAALCPTDAWPRAPINGVVLLDSIPGTETFEQAAELWLRPAIQALRSATLHELRLSLGSRCFSVRASSLRRFWKRPRAWWEYLQFE